MKKNLTKYLLLSAVTSVVFILATGLAIALMGLQAFAQNDTATEANISDHCRRLRIVLYPFIPDYQGFVRHIAEKFKSSSEGKGIALDFIDLTDGYYDSQSDEYIGKVPADIYEIDSVLLTELADAHKIRSLPSALTPGKGEFLKSAQRGGVVGGTLYGYPQWICANFLFYRSSDTAIANIKTLSELKKTIGSKSVGDASLLADLKGRSTLGEFYLMSLFDQFHDWSVIKNHHNFEDPLAPDDRQVSDIVDLAALCDHGHCHSQNRHNFTGTYSREFARRRGRILIGYSESLYYVGAEPAVCSKADNCLSANDLDVSLVPLAGC